MQNISQFERLEWGEFKIDLTIIIFRSLWEGLPLSQEKELVLKLDYFDRFLLSLVLLPALFIQQAQIYRHVLFWPSIFLICFYCPFCYRALVFFYYFSGFGIFQVKYDGQLRTEEDTHSLSCDVHCLRVQKSNSGANKFMKWTDGGYHGSRCFMVVEIINQNQSGRKCGVGSQHTCSPFLALSAYFNNCRQKIP